MVVHAEDGLDEISIAASTHVVELKQGLISEYQISPEEFNLTRGSLDDIRVSTAQESLELIQAAFKGNDNTMDTRIWAARNIIALNAGAALYVSGLENNLQTGIKTALNVMQSGKANKKLNELINQSNRY
jgi:anthranilate phosphoribosyltransferase